MNGSPSTHILKPDAPRLSGGVQNEAFYLTLARRMKIPTPNVTTGQAGETLGDKLARSDGVLCPPAGVDPEIRAPTPDAGNTPVIPPPGSPGGNPNLRPK